MLFRATAHTCRIIQEERMSKQQVEDLRAYVEKMAK